jgi:hypothetical protein
MFCIFHRIPMDFFLDGNHQNPRFDPDGAIVLRWPPPKDSWWQWKTDQLLPWFVMTYKYSLKLVMFRLGNCYVRRGSVIILWFNIVGFVFTIIHHYISPKYMINIYKPNFIALYSMISPLITWYMKSPWWPPVAYDPSVDPSVVVGGDGSGELQSDLELLPVPSSAPGRGPVFRPLNGQIRHQRR